MSSNLTSQDILIRLFSELGITIHDEIYIKDKCRCSQEKVEFAINNLTKKEILDISDENGNITVVCEFCKTKRIFNTFN